LIAERGIDVFYKGSIARAIVTAVRDAAVNPGGLTLDDMASYAPSKRTAVCIFYRGHEICGMPPPSSGGVAVAQILKLLEGFDVGAMEPGSPAAVNLISEAFRLAYADRATYLADSEFVDVPVKGLVNDAYLAARRSLIIPGQIMPDAPAGIPPGTKTAYRTATPGEIPATSHFSIVDGFGNVLAMTTSVESAFGSHMMVGGFLLNNQLTDFTFAPDKNGLPVANRVAGGKRPLSSMSPTLVMDSTGRPVATLGSPGGPLIIGFVAKTLVGLIDWHMNLQNAISLPHFIQFGGSLIVERDTTLWDKQEQLAKIGYNLRPAGLTSGLHGILIHYKDDGGYWLEGGADPRREGTARGD
jgi:gamma-glutamyltranspeptidase/glutathione hydrolase